MSYKRTLITVFVSLFTALSCSSESVFKGNNIDLSPEAEKNLEKTVLQYNKSNKLYFVSGCYSNVDLYHEVSSRYFIIFTVHEPDKKFKGEIMIFKNGNFERWAILKFIKGEFSFDVQGGLWSNLLARDIYEALSRTEFSMVRDLTSNLLVSRSLSQECNAEYKNLDAYKVQ